MFPVILSPSVTAKMKDLFIFTKVEVEDGEFKNTGFSPRWFGLVGRTSVCRTERSWVQYTYYI